MGNVAKDLAIKGKEESCLAGLPNRSAPFFPAGISDLPLYLFFDNQTMENQL